MTMSRDELVALADEIDDGGLALDDLVHGVASNHASDINNAGHEAQIDYLLENGVPAQEIVEQLRIDKDNEDEEDDDGGTHQ